VALILGLIAFLGVSSGSPSVSVGVRTADARIDKAANAAATQYGGGQGSANGGQGAATGGQGAANGAAGVVPSLGGVVQSLTTTSTAPCVVTLNQSNGGLAFTSTGNCTTVGIPVDSLGRWTFNFACGQPTTCKDVAEVTTLVQQLINGVIKQVPVAIDPHKFFVLPFQSKTIHMRLNNRGMRLIQLREGFISGKLAITDRVTGASLGKTLLLLHLA
jgi:hypothetical protein